MTPLIVKGKAVELKKEQPRRSDDTINRFLAEYYGKTITKSTLYRHLKLAGATRLKLGVSQQKVRIRWTRDHTHDLWIGDFQEGPYVLVDGEALPTNLCLFIDCHSRYVVEGRYYLKQTLDILIDSLIFHLKSSGASEKTFDSNVKDLIHEVSAGVPRQINAISTACLINASCKQSQIVTPDIFHQALAEFQSF